MIQGSSSLIQSAYTSRGGIEICQRRFDLGNFGPDIIDFGNLTRDAIIQLPARSWSGLVYVNPEWTILANANVPFRAFYREATFKLVSWRRRLADVFSRKEVERYEQEMLFMTRQLVISGVFFVKGNSLHPMKAKLLSRQ